MPHDITAEIFGGYRILGSRPRHRLGQRNHQLSRIFSATSSLTTNSYRVRLVEFNRKNPGVLVITRILELLFPRIRRHQSTLNIITGGTRIGIIAIVYRRRSII